METVFFEEPATDIFSEDQPCAKAAQSEAHMPINGYHGYIVPGSDDAALAAGDQLKADIVSGRIADFERDEAFCAKNGQSDPDRMVHVSTFEKIDGYIYMTYYANTGTGEERADQQEARLAFCPEGDPADMTVVTAKRSRACMTPSCSISAAMRCISHGRRRWTTNTIGSTAPSAFPAAR